MADIHIASCVVHVRPEQLAETAQIVRTRQLADVSILDARGRFVIVMEARGAGPILDAIENVRALPGVIAVNLVYQHAEDEHALEEPMS